MSSPKGCQMHMHSDSEQSPSSSLPGASRCSWLRLERRMCSSSTPTVETADPLAQQDAPLSWHWRLPNCRAAAIVDVPWRSPRTSATASFPGLPDVTTLNLRPSLESLPGQTRGLPISELLGLLLEHRSSIHAACCVGSVRRANTGKLCTTAQRRRSNTFVRTPR